MLGQSSDCDFKPRVNPLLLLRNKEDHDYLKICAPMVRYSKLPFREMIRDYGVDVCYTPMILADCFHRSKFAQEIEYQTNNADDPIIVQFAAHNSFDLAASAEIVAKYCNGIDINCGCPQKWAINEKIGSHLMSDPELVKDMIRQVKAKISPIKMSDGSALPCSIKIRCVSNDPRDTVEFARRAEAVGVDWIAIHGRTRKQKSSEPVNLDAIKIVKESLNIPVFANGDIFSLKDADMVVEYTKADGVMAARGLLENPAMFAGYDRTPVSAIQKYIDRAIAYGTDQFIFHQHLMYMTEKSMSKTEKKLFNCLNSIPAVLDFFEERLCEFSDPMIPMAEMNDFYSINNLDIEDSTVPYTWSNSVISLDGIMHFKGKSQISDISLSSLTETAMADYRLLHFGWSLADAVLFSGQILRDEPQTSCQIKFDDIISFRRSMGKQSDHPLQLIISKECDFPHDHSIFSSALQIILITSQKGWDNIQHNLNQKTKATVNPLIIQENEPMRDILQRLKIEHNINYLDVSTGGKVINQFIEHKVLNEIRFTLSGQIAGPSDMHGASRPALFPVDNRFSFCANSAPLVRWNAVRGIGDHHLFVRGSLQYRH